MDSSCINPIGFGDMGKQKIQHAAAQAICAQHQQTIENLRALWIAVRVGDESAKVELHRLLLRHPRLKAVFSFLHQETRELRAASGKQNPKYFGNPAQGARPAWMKIQASRVVGVNSIHQGGLPSLGKRSK